MEWFKNLSIGKKLNSNFGLVVILSVLTYSNAADVNETDESFAKDELRNTIGFFNLGDGDSNVKNKKLQNG